MYICLYNVHVCSVLQESGFCLVWWLIIVIDTGWTLGGCRHGVLFAHYIPFAPHFELGLSFFVFVFCTRSTVTEFSAGVNKIPVRSTCRWTLMDKKQPSFSL